jgi:hypothetical protein
MSTPIALTSTSGWTQILQSSEGAAQFSSRGSDFEWFISSTGVPASTAIGHLVRKQVVNPNETMLGLNDDATAVLNFKKPLVSGAILYARITENAGTITKTTTLETFGTTS